VRNVLEAQLLLALAQAARKQGHEARHHLHAVLFVARAEGYRRLFLDEGEAMAALLRTTAPHPREQPLVAYLQDLLHALARERMGQMASDQTVAAELGPLAWPLSPQEQRVLRLLAAGGSNSEIARELFVSVNTVKAHVKSIYRKLNVTSRVEASEAVRRLRLP
jgi:LuxR family maltose regulon positive regulatory protein